MSDKNNEFRFKKYDHSSRPDYSYLDDSDHCFYVGDYTARMGYSYSETNQIIHNLKKKLGDNGYSYKAGAIRAVANYFYKGIGESNIQKWMLVPIPPSGAHGSENYDPRMMKILNAMNALSGNKLDVRELVVQTETTKPAHLSPGERMTPSDLIEIYSINEKLVNPSPERVMVFDDVLTKGAHFKAMQTVIKTQYPNIPVVGMFFAHTVHAEYDFQFEPIDFKEK